MCYSIGLWYTKQYGIRNNASSACISHTRLGVQDRCLKQLMPFLSDSLVLVVTKLIKLAKVFFYFLSLGIRGSTPTDVEIG